MAKGKIYLETTEVPAERSAADLASLLVQSGAMQVATDYKMGRIVGLRFALQVAGQCLLFELPARTEPVFKALLKRSPFNYSRHRGTQEEYEARKREEAERIGWRQLYRWTQAQLALIDIGMVTTHEVFLPYLLMGQRTMSRIFEEDTLKLLPAGESRPQ